jgi:hypothetical protein
MNKAAQYKMKKGHINADASLKKDYDLFLKKFTPISKILFGYKWKRQFEFKAIFFIQLD